MVVEYEVMWVGLNCIARNGDRSDTVKIVKCGDVSHIVVENSQNW